MIRTSDQGDEQNGSFAFHVRMVQRHGDLMQLVFSFVAGVVGVRFGRLSRPGRRAVFAPLDRKAWDDVDGEGFLERRDLPGRHHSSCEASVVKELLNLNGEAFWTFSLVQCCFLRKYNPGKFGDPFKLEITFECYEPLADDLDWELVYVGSGESNAYDQILDSILVGPVVEGRHKFIFEADGPDPSKIPESEIVGVTVLLLKCRYMEQEFINIGWFIATEYTDPEFQEEPPTSPVLEKLQRRVCTDDVRVTTFAIKWHKNEGSMADPINLEDNKITAGEMESDFAVACNADESGGQKQDEETVRDVAEKIEGDLEIDVPLESMAKASAAGLPLLDVTNESIPDLVD
uniref:Uncharacterized protein n=1 Tax=Setaria digitata TaxID=48799 RepID=A0A915PVN8_9BILA